MSYRFKGQKIVISGVEQEIVPRTLPSSPENGYYCIDSSDNKFKVYHESKGRWIILGDAEDVYFDNTNAQLDGSPDNVQDAIEALKGFRAQPIQYQYIGTLNFDDYLYSGTDQVSGLLSSARPSGNTSNGYRYGNSAPATCLYDGTVVSAAASITGLAVSTGNIASSVELKFELWKVGFNNQGTKLGDIIFNIDSNTYSIGNWWNSSGVTGFAESQAQNIDVSAGDLLGLKFIRQTGSNKIVEFTNATIVLEIEGNT